MVTLVGWLVGRSLTSPFSAKHSYIKDERSGVESYSVKEG